MPAGSASPSLWQVPAFRSYWLARVALVASYQILGVAIGWQMYGLTGRAFDLGLVGLLQFIPRVALVLPAGGVVDRYSRNAIVAISLGAQALISLVLLAASMHWGLPLSRALLLLLALLIGCCRSFDMPALQAVLPSLLPQALLPPAIAVSAAATETATVVAPALGGLLFAAGAQYTYGLNAGVEVLGLLLMLSLPRPAQATSTHITLSSMFEGIGHIRTHRTMLGAISLDLFAVLLGGATALLPIYARDILHVGAWGLGLLRAAPAAGALLMSFWLIHHPIGRRSGVAMFSAVACFGLATIVFALSTRFTLSLLALVVLGASDVISVVIRGTLVQLQTPDALRGRVNAVNALFIGASNQLGEFESGMAAAWLGTVPSVLVGGIGTLLVVAVWLRLFPELARSDRLETSPEA